MDMQLDEPALRWLRLLSFATAVAVVVIGISQRSPGPGTSGDGLGVLLGLVVFVGAIVGLMRLPFRSVRLQLGLVLLLLGASTALLWLQPSGGSYLGAFVAIAVAALRLPARLSTAVVALALVALPVAGAATDKPRAGIALVDVGIVAFYTMAFISRRLREAHRETARLLEELEETRDAQVRAAALGERQRLAREIHDVLAHSLSALLLQLEGTRLLARERGDDRIGEAVERAHELAKSGLDEARRAIATLRDEELPGPDRLGTLASEFEEHSDVPCRVEIVGEPRELAPEARLAVYRVAQEALTNVRRHTDAILVQLRLGYEPDGVRLVVEDVAAGGERNGSGGGGYGLTGMRERAELLGGRLLAGATDSGFRVELWIPA